MPNIPSNNNNNNNNNYSYPGQNNMNYGNHIGNNYNPYDPQQERTRISNPSKNSKGMYILLITIIICFAVIIALMFTLMRSILDGGNKKDVNDNNILMSETTSQNEQQQDLSAVTTAPAEIPTQIVTVTVIVEVEKPQNDASVENTPSTHSDKFEVLNYNLPVYSSAGYNSGITGYITDKGTYTIIEYSGDWGKLKNGGWINFEDAESGGTVSYLGNGYVSTEKDPLNVRNGADINTKIITSIPRHTDIEIYSTDVPGWYYTTYNGKSGFIDSWYVTLYPQKDISNSVTIGDSIGYGYVSTKKDPLTMRNSATTDSKSLTTIPKDTVIELYETSNYQWYYTTYNGKSGFVKAEYITLGTPPQTTIGNSIGYGYINTKSDPLTLRASTTTDSKQLTTIPKNTSLEFYSTSDPDWYYTTYNGKSGFVKAEYIAMGNPPESTSVEGFYGYGTIATEKDPLNLRSEPSTNASIVTTIPKGASVELYVTNKSGWYYTTYNGKSGYVKSDYISMDSIGYGDMIYGDSMGSTATVSTKGDVLNLRSSASSNGSIIIGIPNGTTITVIEYGSDWCYVEYNGSRGYASTEYLSF